MVFTFSKLRETERERERETQRERRDRKHSAYNCRSLILRILQIWNHSAKAKAPVLSCAWQHTSANFFQRIPSNEELFAKILTHEIKVLYSSLKERGEF